MAVYVDWSTIPYGRMTMCHMMADSTAELLTMAARLGLAQRHIQDPGTYREHFDVSKAYKARAIGLGARCVSSRELVARMHQKRPPAERPQWTVQLLERIEARR